MDSYSLMNLKPLCCFQSSGWQRPGKGNCNTEPWRLSSVVALHGGGRCFTSWLGCSYKDIYSLNREILCWPIRELM